MPMPLFSRNAPAPGSSYLASNAVLKGVRVALGLADPVRILFSGLGIATESLSKWLQDHRHFSVRTLQLRKEQKDPFFHEYLALSLSDNGGYYRIDRRQLPTEGSPLDSTEDAGVEAYDTIEQMSNMDHSIYNRSECLIEIEFEEDVRLDLIIDICREISLHEMANVYTVQRYNCYFYAQTVLLCTLCKVYGWYESNIWGSGDAGYKTEEAITTDMSLSNLCPNPRISIRISDKKLHPHLVPSEAPRPGIELSLSSERGHKRKLPIRGILPQRKGDRSNHMKEVDIGDLQECISDMIHAHSVRVEQYKMVLKCNAWDVEWDIKKAMDEIWGRRWLLLGQVESTILQPPVPQARRFRCGRKGGQNSGTGRGAGLRRRPRVAPKKEWEKDWEVVDLEVPDG